MSFYKKWWFWVILILCIVIIILAICLVIKPIKVGFNTNMQECIEGLESMNLEPEIDYVPGEMLVLFYEGVSNQSATDILEGFNVKIIKSYSIINSFLVEVDEGKEFEWICKLQEDPNVESAELNGIGHTAI